MISNSGLKIITPIKKYVGNILIVPVETNVNIFIPDNQRKFNEINLRMLEDVEGVIDQIMLTYKSNNPNKIKKLNQNKTSFVMTESIAKDKIVILNIQ